MRSVARLRHDGRSGLSYSKPQLDRGADMTCPMLRCICCGKYDHSSDLAKHETPIRQALAEVWLGGAGYPFGLVSVAGPSLAADGVEAWPPREAL